MPGRLIPTALVGAVLAVSGCLDGGTPYCEETIMVLGAVDEPTPAGSSAADVLAVIEGEFTSEFTWSEQGGTAVSVATTPGMGPTPLTLSIAYEAGEVRWVDNRVVNPPGPSDAIGVECLSRLEIDARLGFATEDGAFAELVDVVIGMETDYGGELHWAAIVHEFDPDQLAGTLEVVSIDPADPDEIEYDIELRIPLDAATDLEPGVPRGYVDGVALYDGHGPAPAGTIAIGEFELGRFGF